MKKYLLICVSLFVFILIACDPANKPARGFEDEIFVVADSSDYDLIGEALGTALEKEIYTPLKTQDAVVLPFEVKIYDAQKNHLTTGKIFWQIKEWQKVKTKVA